ncbi:LuxR C-terminal-related transcriptional regulator [Paenibacillus sp. LjRoot153]|uniref:response regulator transcription factor n=1 Tax=Paenibacillus sp. LjRoot153 TaxID=3342270 RepID=UPI003ECC998C
MKEDLHHRKNGDMHASCSTEYERMNEFLIQETGTSMDVFSTRYQITKRESEIFLMVAIYGFSNHEIAERCRISEKTVKIHLANIMNKAGIKSMRRLLSLLFNHVLYFHESNRLSEEK